MSSKPPRIVTAPPPVVVAVVAPRREMSQAERDAWAIAFGTV
jgi:hypothetical protein